MNNQWMTWQEIKREITIKEIQINRIGKRTTVTIVTNKSTLISKFGMCSINVCGIKLKLNYPEFIQFINIFDIVGVQESKLDNLDSICVPCFSVFVNNRTESSRYRSGGIAILIKEKYSLMSKS